MPAIFKNKFVSYLTVTIVSLLLVSVVYYQNQVKKLEQGNKVVDVFDGDTMKLQSGQRVRLKTANAPELTLCGGAEAKELMEKLSLNKVIRLEEAVLDRWGRWTGLVYVDDSLLDEEMIRAGWAKYNSTKSTRVNDLKAASKYAQENALGIYNKKCRQTENLANPKCNIKGNIDQKKDVLVYHLPGCPGYDQTIIELSDGDAWFCTEEEAVKAGFKKASACK